jgi:phosphate transport system ATP-binding protein
MRRATAAPEVEVVDLVVRHHDRRVVGPVTFSVAAGERFGLRGPSGAGKSTVLRALVGLLPPELTATGSVRVHGFDVLRRNGDLAGLRARAVLVGQIPVVFPDSILGNTVFGLRHVARMPRAQLRERAEVALREAGLWDEVCDRLHSPADQLSVGQRQRLCFARALALDPSILFLDEPTSALDAGARSVVEAAIGGIRGTRAVVVVTHDSQQLQRLCHDVLELGAA